MCWVIPHHEQSQNKILGSLWQSTCLYSQMRCILSNQFSLKGCAKAQQAEKVNQVQCADLVCCLWYNRDLMCFVLDWLNIFFTVWKNRFWIESSYASTEFSRQLFLLVGVGGYLCHLFLWNLEELFSRVCGQDYEVNYSDFRKLPADIFWQSWSAVKLCILWGYDMDQR